jgi:phosphate transport system substrate-binding protein
MRKVAILWALIPLLVGFSLPAVCQNVIALVGSGSNLPTPLYTNWIEEYNKLNSGIQVRYLSVGTVKGIDDISRGVGDFAAGEVPMTDEQLKSAQTPLLQIPTVLVAIVPIYNLPGIKHGLRFSGPVLADIFLGNIKSWDDPRLKELRDHLTKNADYVGPRFPDEARKIHYGETEHRSIYGEASPEEAKELHEEGIDFHTLPILPDELN